MAIPKRHVPPSQRGEHREHHPARRPSLAEALGNPGRQVSLDAFIDPSHPDADYVQALIDQEKAAWGGIDAAGIASSVSEQDEIDMNRKAK